MPKWVEMVDKHTLPSYPKLDGLLRIKQGTTFWSHVWARWLRPHLNPLYEAFIDEELERAEALARSEYLAALIATYGTPQA